jgi:enoyl-CoA hydratase/carnithine racemase
MSNYSNSPKLQISIQAHTAILTLNNPAANVFDEESLGELPRVVEK